MYIWCRWLQCGKCFVARPQRWEWTRTTLNIIFFAFFLYVVIYLVSGGEHLKHPCKSERVFLMRVMLQYFKVLWSFLPSIEERRVFKKKWGVSYTIGYIGLYRVYRMDSGRLWWIVVDYGEKWSIMVKSGRFGRFRSILMKTPGGTHGFHRFGHFP